MSTNRLILLAVKSFFLTARTGTGASNTFALPARTSTLTWQTSFDIAPAAVNITIRVSIDGINWTVIDTSTVVGGEVRTIAATTSALFIDANVVTNTGNRQVTVTVVAKVANS
jgi:hypothetical protein